MALVELLEVIRQGFIDENGGLNASQEIILMVFTQQLLHPMLSGVAQV